MKKDILKKKIIYRSKHRGTKEMDLILSSFVKKYIDFLNEKELIELESLLNIDDGTLYKWYLNEKATSIVPNNNLTTKLREFKI